MRCWWSSSNPAYRSKLKLKKCTNIRTTPVPFSAGLSITLALPKLPTYSCGIVVPTTGTSTKFGTLGYQDGYYYFLIGTPTPGNTTDCTVTISYTTWTNVTKTYSFSIEPEDSIYQDLSYSLAYADGTSCSSVLTCSIDNSAKTFTLVNKAEFSQEIILKLYLTDLPSIYTNISITYSS